MSKDNPTIEVPVAWLQNLIRQAKATFDNARDTTQLMYAAQEVSDALVMAVEHRVRPRVEELLVQRLEDSLSKGGLVMRVGDKLYEINFMENKTNE